MKKRWTNDEKTMKKRWTNEHVVTIVYGSFSNFVSFLDKDVVNFNKSKPKNN